MFIGNGRYITILVSSPILLGCVAMILASIVLLKKRKQYNKHMRGLMITLLIGILGITIFLLYLAIGSGSS